MGKITFIVGGARSGKSTFALACAGKRAGGKRAGKKTVFIATCQPLDAEMRARIASHKKSRPRHWVTIDEPQRVSAAVERIDKTCDVIVIDCLTLLVSNLLLKKRTPESILEEIGALCGALRRSRARAFVVSNEVGLGIVPAHPLGRKFRDIAGSVNQRLAAASDEVFFMVSGIPWRIK